MELLAGMGRNPVGANDHFLAGAVFDPVFFRDPLFLEHHQHLPVVDERPEGADVLSVLALFDRFHRHLDGIADAFAETGCSGDNDFHLFLTSCFHTVLKTRARNVLNLPRT
jgi:hypothetical protein